MRASGSALRLSLLLVSSGLVSCSGGTEPAGPPPPPPSSPKPSALAIQAGDNQAAAPSAPLEVPPAVIIRNEQGQPLPGVLVKFTVEAGGGSLKTDTVRSGSDGVARASSWRLGPLPAENRLKASLDPLPPVTFTATGRLLVPTTLIEGNVVLPAGVRLKPESLQVKSSVTDVPVTQSGNYTAVNERGVVHFGAVHAPNDNPVMFGWLDDQHKVFTARTTAEVLAYFDLGGFLLPNPEVRQALRDWLAHGADLSALESAIAAALAGDPATVSLATGTIDQARRGLVAHLTTAASGPQRGTTIDPSGEPKSGLTVDQAGFQLITVTHRFRRRVAYFLDRVSYVTSDGRVVDSKLEGEPVELPAVLYATTVPGVLADVASGSPVTLPVISEPVSTPIFPSDATATHYHLTVVGPGGEEPNAELTPAKRAAIIKAGVETYLFEIMLPLLDQLLAANGELGKYKVDPVEEAKLLKRFMDLNPAGVLEALSKGDVPGAWDEFRKVIVDSEAGQNFVFDLVVGPVAKHIGLNGSTLVDGLGRYQKILGRLEMAATGFAIVKSFVDMEDARRAEQFDVTVSKAKVTLSPPGTQINQLDIQFFKATVTDATGSDDHPVFRYRWSTSGNFGKICNAQNDSGHPCDTHFTTSGDGVTYEPDVLKEGTDDIKVLVYIVVDGTEEVIGDASGTITTFASKVTIAPSTVSMHNGQSRSFSAILDTRLDDGGTKTYHWTTPGQFGVFTLGATDAETTLPSILYAVTSDQEGSETVSVEVFSTTNGARHSLGKATAKIKIEKDKPTTVQGSWNIETTSLAQGKLCLVAYLKFPLVQGAKSYEVNAHDFHDNTGAIPSPLRRTFSTAQFQDFLPCSDTTWGRSGSDGSQYVYFLSGFGGPAASAGSAEASFQSRFGGMVIDVTVKY